MVNLLFETSFIENDEIIAEKIKALEKYQKDPSTDNFTTVVFIADYGIHDLNIVDFLKASSGAKGFFVCMHKDEDAVVSTIRQILKPNKVFSLNYGDANFENEFTELLATRFENDYTLQPLETEGKFKDKREAKLDDELKKVNFRFQ